MFSNENNIKFIYMYVCMYLSFYIKTVDIECTYTNNFIYMSKPAKNLTKPLKPVFSQTVILYVLNC